MKTPFQRQGLLWFLRPFPSEVTSSLLKHAINLVLVVKFEGLGRLGSVNTLPIEKEAEG
jgi:hypothetical protein